MMSISQPFRLIRAMTSEAPSDQEVSFPVLFRGCGEDRNKVVDDDRFVVAHLAASELALQVRHKLVDPLQFARQRRLPLRSDQ